MHRRLSLSFVFVLLFSSVPLAAKEPAETIAAAQTVLAETLSTPGSEIPAKLLADAYGVAIVPGVIKVGFVGAVRRGHGVVILKDKEGNWGAPQFITLTGGSVGWQIGAQSSDIVLVFNSERSVEGMLKGKFTIGADAAAAAGPVGRNVAAATDAQLKAELLTYSRSRGLFAGVSIDGSALEIDPGAAATYYAARPGEAAQVPKEAIKLVETIAALSSGNAKVDVAPARVEERVLRVDQPEALRAELAASAVELNALLKDEWRRYLALPKSVYEGKALPSAAALAPALANFEKVAAGRDYASLNQRPEFQRTLELLRALHAAVRQESAPLDLPPPPR